MLQRVFVLCVCLSAFSPLVFGKPAYKSDIKTCYTQKCPDDTFACEKISNVSPDKKFIETEIHCLGIAGKLLSNITSSTPNPYGPTLHFQSYSYQGSFSIDNDSDSTESTRKPETTDKKDTEQNGPKEVEKTTKRSGGKGSSEIDDLNKVPTAE